MSANDYGIKPEWARAWQWCNNPKRAFAMDAQPLADGFLHLLAALMEAEFKREHRLDGRRGLMWCVKCGYGSLDRADLSELRHNYDHDAWLAAAKAKMEELGR